MGCVVPDPVREVPGLVRELLGSVRKLSVFGKLSVWAWSGRMLWTRDPVPELALRSAARLGPDSAAIGDVTWAGSGKKSGPAKGGGE